MDYTASERELFWNNLLKHCKSSLDSRGVEVVRCSYAGVDEQVITKATVGRFLLIENSADEWWRQTVDTEAEFERAVEVAEDLGDVAWSIVCSVDLLSDTRLAPGYMNRLSL